MDHIEYKTLKLQANKSWRWKEESRSTKIHRGIGLKSVDQAFKFDKSTLHTQIGLCLSCLCTYSFLQPVQFYSSWEIALSKGYFRSKWKPCETTLISFDAQPTGFKRRSLFCDHNDLSSTMHLVNFCWSGVGTSLKWWERSPNSKFPYHLQLQLAEASPLPLVQTNPKSD